MALLKIPFKILRNIKYTKHKNSDTNDKGTAVQYPDSVSKKIGDSTEKENIVNVNSEKRKVYYRRRGGYTRLDKSKYEELQGIDLCSKNEIGDRMMNKLRPIRDIFAIEKAHTNHRTLHRERIKNDYDADVDADNSDEIILKRPLRPKLKREIIQKNELLEDYLKKEFSRSSYRGSSIPPAERRILQTNLQQGRSPRSEDIAVSQVYGQPVNKNMIDKAGEEGFCPMSLTDVVLMMMARDSR